MIEGVIDSDVCLRRLVTPSSRTLLNMFGHYKNGHLFRAGGLAEQPLIYLEAMQVIDGHLGSRDGD